MSSFLETESLVRIGDLRKTKAQLPRARGVYGLFFGTSPGHAPTTGCLTRDGGSLLYIGTAGADLGKKGTLRNRLGDHHLGGNERRSTVCQTLCALMPDLVGLAVAKNERGKIKFHTSSEGAQRLRHWMDENISVCWITASRPADHEMTLVRQYRTPLNIEFGMHPFVVELHALRTRRRETAAGTPIGAL